MKENDYFLNLLANPTFNPRDFRDVGLTMENTSLEDKETYKNIEQIRNNLMFQTDGAFDESKFDSAYSMASTSFKVFSDNDLINKISNDPVFDKHDIFVDRSKRIEDKEFKIVKTANPLRERRGLLGTDDVHESEFSVRENAQKELVWDGATNSWQEAPNDNFWENWKHTRVLAQYDEDEFDPITGEKIHYKGEKKLNENGTYYYENLNDRDIYGREVLSKFDTLTVDGSNWNKFDFFDSDDKKKTIAGTLVKNVIKTAPAFIPGINTWYVGARMAMNLTELMAKMGKVFGGSDNPTLSAIEGYIDSLSFSSSDYAQGSPEAEKKPHVWSLENIINMGGDVFLQLAEQRWLFERGPSLFMGKAGYDSKAAEAMKNAELARIAKENNALMLANHAKYKGAFEQIKKASDSNVVNSLMEAYTKQYNTIGKHISKAYMTGIVSAEAYGDAKAQGLSDQEAAALTIGYALLEYGLLSTDVGKWVLPELSRDKLQMKLIVRKRLTDLAKNPELKMPDIKASNTEKRNWVKKMVAAGLRLAQATHDPAVSAIKASAAGAIAEGVEETSEELLYDLSKALFNLGSYLRDSDTKITAFDDVLNRYALSFVGGAMGGGLMSLKSDYKQAKQTKNLTADQAYLMTVHYVDLGQEHELLKTARKMILDSPDLAIETPEIEGIPQYKSGNPSNNKNLAAIDAFTNEVNMIKSLLQANGGLVSDESLMSILTDSDKRFRLAALQSSNFMPSYLQEFNSLQVKIYNKAKEIENAYESLNKIATSDSAKNKSEAYENAKQDTESEVKRLKKELKDLVEEKKEWLSGAKTNEYIERAAFEMMAEVSSVFATTNFVKFAEQKTKEKYGEKATINDATDEDLEKFKEAWIKYKESGYKDDLEIAFRIFKQVNPLASGLISSFVSKYLESKDNVFTRLQGLLSGSTAAILASKDVEEQIALVENKIRPSELMQLYHVKASLLHLLSTKFGIPENDYSSLDNNTQSLYLTEDLASILDDGGLLYLEDLIDKLEFITTAEKEFLTKALTDVLYLTLDKSNKYHHLSDRIAKLNNKIRNKKHTPILELLDAWNVSTGSPKKTSALIKELEASLIEATVQGQIKEFTLGADIQEQINGAIANAKLLIGAILAARTDNVSEANIVGYNMLINSINSDSNLATIDKNSANVLLQELNSVINTLLYAKKVNAINTGQKLEEENDLDNKFTYLLHSAVSSNLQRLLTNAPDDELVKKWNGVLELSAAFNSLKLLNDPKFDKTKVRLNELQRVQLKKDKIAMEDAIFEFFQKNKDADLEELIESLGINLTIADTGTINIEMDQISPARFIAWLASRASIKMSDFHRLHYNTIPDSIAPLVGLETAMSIIYAMFTLGENMYKFAKAFNKVLAKQWEKHRSNSDDIWARSFEDALDSDVSIDFFRTVLLDGIAGAGKTQAVVQAVILMLNNLDSTKHLLDNPWFVAPTKEAAAWIAKKAGFKIKMLDNETFDPTDDFFKNNCFSREEVLKLISPDYQDKVFDPVTGKQILKEDQLQLGEDGFYRYKYKLNKSIKGPTMMIMDEVTGFSLLDMFLIEDFSELHSIMNVAAGDFDLATLHGDIESSELNMQLFAGNFMGSWKLGTSIRTEVKLLDLNNRLLRANLRSLKQSNQTLSGEPLEFKYYEDGKTVLGYKNVNPETGDSYSHDEIKESIKKWLDAGEIVGFIYDTLEGDLWDIMLELNQEYPGKIDFKQGTTALGQERNYYVMSLHNIDLDGLNEVQKQEKYLLFWETAYTGFTRAKRGVIFDIGDLQPVSNSSYSEDVGEYSLGVESIKAYNLVYRGMMEKVLEDTTMPEITYKPFGDNQKVLQKKPENVTKIPSLQFTEDDSVYTIIENKDGVVTYEDEKGNKFEESVEDFGKKDIQFITNDFSPEETHKKNSDLIPIDNSDEASLHMLLQTFNTKETGAEVDSDGKLIKPDNFDVRFDSVNGLIKLFDLDWNNIDKDVSAELIKILDKIRSRLTYNKGALDIAVPEAIKNAVLNSSLDKELKQRALSKLENLEYHYIFKSSEYNYKKTKGRFEKFFKGIKEKLRGIFSKEEKAVLPKNKNISVYVTDVNGLEILEIPMMTFTFPLLLLNTKGFEDIAKIVEGKPSETVAEKNALLTYLLELLEQRLPHKKINLGQNMLKLIKLYRFNENKIVYLDKSMNQMASSVFQSTGPLISPTHRGGVDNFYFSGENMALKEYMDISGNYVSEIISALTPVVINGEVVVEAGNPFVLVSDSNDFVNTDGILLAYMQQIETGSAQKRIKRVYVNPPAASVEEFLENLIMYYSKTSSTTSPEVDALMGNELSIFRMLQMITSDKKGRMKELLNTTGNIELDHFNKATEIVKALTEILDTYGMEEFLNVFRGVPTESHGVKIGKLGDLGIDKRTQSWKNALSKYFVRLMASELDASSSYKNPSKEGMANLSKRTELLKNLLKENKWEGVYYHMKLKKGEEVKLRQFKLMDYDKTNITFRNKPITIDRKIDTNAYVADVLPVIDEILNAILDENGNYLGNHLNKDTIEYLNNKKSLPEIVETKEPLGYKIPFEVPSHLESTIKSLIEANPDKILEEILKDNNYMYLINESGKYQIIDKLNTGDSWDVDSGILLRDGIKYGNIQFDPSKQAFVLTRVDSTLPQNSEVLIPTDEDIFNAFTQAYEGLELDSNQGYLGTIKQWIKDAADDFNLFYDLEVIDNQDSLYDLFTYMLDTDDASLANLTELDLDFLKSIVNMQEDQNTTCNTLLIPIDI